MPPNNYNGQPTQGYPVDNSQQPAPVPQMQSQHGNRAVFILMVLFALLFLSSGAFGLWAFSERSDLKNNLEQRVSVEVDKAVSQAEAKKDAEFAEREKSPLVNYQGPSAFGSVSIKYPKTWSALVDESGKGSKPVNGYFHPSIIPGVNSDTAYALRLEVLESEYSTELKKFDGDVKSGKVTVNPIQIQGVTGARVDGEIDRNKNGSAVLLPLRDKTLKLSTESEQFVKDFNEIILKELSFSP